MCAARVIRQCRDDSDDVTVVEHDRAILDCMADSISLLYGTPGAFGVREGINHFLHRDIPTANARSRKDELIFQIHDDAEMPVLEGEHRQYKYPCMHLTFGAFQIEVEKGFFRNGQIIVLLGQNGIGKKTFIRMLASQQAADDFEFPIPELSVSDKPKKIRPRFEGTVEQLLDAKIQEAMAQGKFKEMVVQPLN
jgi:ATP-binding cassette subfamily E protein 1